SPAQVLSRSRRVSAARRKTNSTGRRAAAVAGTGGRLGADAGAGRTPGAGQEARLGPGREALGRTSSTGGEATGDGFADGERRGVTSAAGAASERRSRRCAPRRAMEEADRCLARRSTGARADA